MMMRAIPASIFIIFVQAAQALAAAKEPEKGSPIDNIGIFFEGFSSLAGIQKSILDAVEKTKAIILHPTQFRREVVLIISILVITLLVIVIFVLMVSANRQRRELRKTLDSVRTKQVKFKKTQRVVALIVILIVVGLAAIVGVSQPTFCASCHQIEPSFKSWATSTHRSISCLDCHADPGISGFLVAQFGGFDNLLRTRSSENIKIKTRVRNQACLNCHQKIYERTKVSGTLVRHKELIDANIACVDCHIETSHGKAVKYFIMDKCVVCHDGKQAKSECGTCHKEDIAKKKELKIEDFPKVRSTKIKCYTSCHSDSTNKLCIDCHGVIMPHPEYFKGIHAYVSNKRPSLCARCHFEARGPEKNCNCHGTGDIHGKYSEWFPKHSGEGYRLMGGSCTCHKWDFCGGCHNANQFRDTY